MVAIFAAQKALKWFCFNTETIGDIEDGNHENIRRTDFDGNISAAMASLIDAVELPEVPQPVAHLYKPLAKIDRAAEQEKKAKQSTANRKQRAKEILEGK